jgi:hypothetical protein
VALAENCRGEDLNNVVENLLGNLAQQWADQDMQAACDWALAQPPGEQRDRLLQRIAIVESRINPVKAAARVVMQMSPGELQYEAAMSVLNQWAQLDAEAAMKWAQIFPEEELRIRAINEVLNVSACSGAGN